MFIDLKNATGSAEKLGHIKFSQLLQDCFYDITPLMRKYKGEVYQYVGDEIVVTWKRLAGIKNLNCEHITVAEVGVIKREIAYHGDTINTASRIQDQCTKYDKQFLISGQLFKRINNHDGFNLDFIDKISLRGKANAVEIYSVVP